MAPALRCGDAPPPDAQGWSKEEHLPGLAWAVQPT
uniref:Uncharacterized protein n=1 Tax=Arundo donax TaxID=35708 RepID=A0A0A9FUA6_ARUDO